MTITEAIDPARTGAYYDLVAKSGEYDTMYNSPACDGEDNFIAGILTNWVKGDVLDIGCGSGLFLEMQRFGLTRNKYDRYVGIDVSGGLLQQASQKFPKEEFYQQDMHDLSFPDHSFDTIVSLYGPFSYSLNPANLLTEFRRVLRPNGRLFFMPYTARTGHKIHLGGESTAIEPSIRKIFYSDELTREHVPYPFKQVKGMNYFINPLVEMIEKDMLNPQQISTQTFEEIIEDWSEAFCMPCPPNVPYNVLNKQVQVWKSVCGKKGPRNGDECLKILKTEEELTIYLPPEFARHMYVIVDKAC